MTPFEQIVAILDAATFPERPETPARVSAPKNKTGGRRQAAAPPDPSAASVPPPAAAADLAGASSHASAAPSRPGLRVVAGTMVQNASSQSGGSDEERIGSRRATRARAAAKGGQVNAADLTLSFYPHTDLGNAERFAARFKGKLLHCPALGWLLSLIHI